MKMKIATPIGTLTSAAVLALMSVSEVAAAIRISDSSGGDVGSYLRRYADIRRSGEQVVIDGRCLSACTLVLGVVPRDRICVTPRAVLGFHAAWTPDAHGRPIKSRWATRAMLNIYPSWLRRWIARQGGLSDRILYLRGRALAAKVRTCRETSTRSN